MHVWERQRERERDSFCLNCFTELVVWINPLLAVSLKTRLLEGYCKCMCPLGTAFLMPPGWRLHWLGPAIAACSYIFEFIFLSRLHGGTWKCFPEIHPKSCSLTCFLKSIYNAFKCWWFQTFCDPCYMSYSYFEEIETILWVWKIVFWGWEGSPLPCTSSSVKPVSASTSKTCQGEANLGRIHFLNTRTPTRIHAHHHKQSPLHADTWSLQIIPAPPWLEKIRESWKMPLWKRNHLLTFTHFKRYHRCCDEVIECNANKHKKMMKAIWSWSYDNLKAPFITYRSPQSFILMFIWV